MKSPPAPSSLALKALRALSSSLASRVHPLQWWAKEVSSLPSKVRQPLLHEMATILARNMKGISTFAQSLNVNKFQHGEEFDSVLFDFLLPLHEALILREDWNQALELEVEIYLAFIKQDEHHGFYERAFAELYAPYVPLLNTTVDGVKAPIKLSPDASGPIEGDTLFWFQNYTVLAHTQLVLDLTTHLPMRAKFFASALNNFDLESSHPIFSQAGIEILEVDDSQSYATRCDALIQLCKNRGISNIVAVSLPLQFGYLKRICDGITLTWWSMKYPLGCISHFDRLVCNRTLYPTLKMFHGALWQCAPFALRALPPHPAPPSLGTGPTDLNIGVLSRVEKFASSDLPEILRNSLLAHPKHHLFWTGYTENPHLLKRLDGHPEGVLSSQVHFVGWVDPATFLTQVDLLVDTPNLGGLAAFWAMSMGKVVISASETGSIGALGSRQELQTHFQLLSSPQEVNTYFATPCSRPYYLSEASLIPLCLAKYEAHRELLKDHGQRFSRFFINVLSDMERWSLLTYQMLKGSNTK
jgi:hypothetical protein